MRLLAALGLLLAVVPAAAALDEPGPPDPSGPRLSAPDLADRACDTVEALSTGVEDWTSRNGQALMVNDDMSQPCVEDERVKKHCETVRGFQNPLSV